MARDGFTVIRRSTVAWLLDNLKPEADRSALEDDIAADLREVADKVEVQVTSSDPLRILAPVLSNEEHLDLAMRDTDLPRSQQGFAKTIVDISLGIFRNEAEAAERILEERKT